MSLSNNFNIENKKVLMQLYYDDEKYYKGKSKTNSITSLFEAINYGIEYGLNKSGIVPY